MDSLLALSHQSHPALPARIARGCATDPSVKPRVVPAHCTCRQPTLLGTSLPESQRSLLFAGAPIDTQQEVFLIQHRKGRGKKKKKRYRFCFKSLNEQFVLTLIKLSEVNPACLPNRQAAKQAAWQNSGENNSQQI